MVVIFPERTFIKKTGIARQGYFLDTTLKYNIDNFLIRAVERSHDGIFVISGLEGCELLDEEIFINNTINSFRSIKDNVFFNTKAWDFKTKKVVDAIAQKVSTGKKEVFEIELENGKKTHCSEDHRFFIKEGENIVEKRLKEMRIGDSVLWVEGRSD